MVQVFHEALGLKGVTLKVNSLGDPEDRTRYSAALRAFLSDKQAQLSADSQRRLERNPLRILDSKAPQDQEIVAQAPTPLDHLSDAARAHFERVQQGLTELEIPFVVEPRLVRGLDYYTRTVFEVQAESGLGAQNTVAAGGRYDNLVAQLGGTPTPGVGFAGGIERLVLLLQEAGLAVAPQRPELMLIGADDAGRKAIPKLALQLRRLGLRVEVDHRGRKVKALFKRADKEGVHTVLVLGDRELSEGKGQLKQMATGDVTETKLDPASLFASVGAIVAKNGIDSSRP